MSGWYPKNPNLAQVLQSNVSAETPDRAYIAHVEWTALEALVADADGVLVATTDTGVQQVITTGILALPCARNLTATAGGTATDIKAIQVIVVGTDINDVAITETLPVFTVDTAGIVTGNKAFKTVTSITIPAHDGTGATTAVGFGDKLGLPYFRPQIPCIHAFLATVLEATAPTIVAGTTLALISSSTIDLNSALNGTAVDVYLAV